MESEGRINIRLGSHRKNILTKAIGNYKQVRVINNLVDVALLAYAKNPDIFKELIRKNVSLVITKEDK